MSKKRARSFSGENGEGGSSGVSSRARFLALKGDEVGVGGGGGSGAEYRAACARLLAGTSPVTDADLTLLAANLHEQEVITCCLAAPEGVLRFTDEFVERLHACAPTSAHKVKPWVQLSSACVQAGVGTVGLYSAAAGLLTLNLVFPADVLVLDLVNRDDWAPRVSLKDQAQVLTDEPATLRALAGAAQAPLTRPAALHVLAKLITLCNGVGAAVKACSIAGAAPHTLTLLSTVHRALRVVLSHHQEWDATDVTADSDLTFLLAVVLFAFGTPKRVQGFVKAGLFSFLERCAWISEAEQGFVTPGLLLRIVLTHCLRRGQTAIVERPRLLQKIMRAARGAAAGFAQHAGAASAWVWVLHALSSKSAAARATLVAHGGLPAAAGLAQAALDRPRPLSAHDRDVVRVALNTLSMMAITVPACAQVTAAATDALQTFVEGCPGAAADVPTLRAVLHALAFVTSAPRSARVMHAVVALSHSERATTFAAQTYMAQWSEEARTAVQGLSPGRALLMRLPNGGGGGGGGGNAAAVVSAAASAHESEARLCALCLEETAEGSLKAPCCRGGFHIACLAQWFDFSAVPSCPCCRADYRDVLPW